MALTTKEAFKIAFLHTCKEAGLTLEQTSELLEKRAFGIGAATIGAGILSPMLVGAGTMGLLGGGYLAGRATGKSLAAETDATPTGKDAEAEERANAYRQLAAKIRSRIKSQQRIQ